MIALLAAVLGLFVPTLPGGTGAPAPAAALVQVDSLLAAAQRAAQAWRLHQFGDLVGGGIPVVVSLPGAAATAPLRPPQAAELLRAFAEGAEELTVEVTLARAVDRDRAYVEILREFTPRGSRDPERQTVYLGLRRSGAGFRVSEVRVVP